MSGYHLTHAADVDVFEILAFIAQDRPMAAAKLHAAFIEGFERAAAFPRGGWGAGAPDPTVRAIGVSSYTVSFKQDDDGVLILRVTHGRRDLGALLGEDG